MGIIIIKFYIKIRRWLNNRFNNKYKICRSDNIHMGIVIKWIKRIINKTMDIKDNKFTKYICY